MKKKKLKKLAKLIFDEVNLLQKGQTPVRERVDYVPYDKEVSEKTKNLILELMKYGDNVRINLSEDSFNTHYEDKDMYSQLFEVVSKRVMENNKENFTEIWDRVVKESGIIRDNNLNKLFDE